jgi:cytochrome c553
MRFIIARVLVASCLLAGPAYAAADIAAGQAKAAICAGCHGEKNIPEMTNVPVIAGQHDKYLQWQLVFFRSERRKSEFMNPIAADLTDEDVRNLGAYFASLPRAAVPVGEVDAALSDKGKQIVADHHCSACHLDNFEGKDAAPAISHQHKDYLIKALTDYRSGARPSTGVAAMNEAASGLSDDEIKAIASYLEAFR